MLAFLGGTGPEGRGLALRLALAGERAIIGSRDAGRAASAAEEMQLLAPGTHIEGAVNTDAATKADLVFLTFPYEGQRLVLEQLHETLTGKVVVIVIAPIQFERGRGASAVAVQAGSAAQEAQNLLPNSLVVAAFQNVSAVDLQEPDTEMEGDVIVCSDHREAKERVMELVKKIPKLRPVDGAGLANAQYVEQITPLLVNINRIYKIHAGIKITGL